jgi:4-alpha-glucanotransferase
LPNKNGLGTFSSECYKFIDFLHEGGFGCWQVLPFADCGYGLSPYSAISSFAINPYFIDLTEFLSDEEIGRFGLSKENELYDQQVRFEKALDLVYKKHKHKFNITDWEKENSYWLQNYVDYRVLSKIYSTDWTKFAKGLDIQKPSSMIEFRKVYAKDLDREKFIQYIAEFQWKKIRKYANSKGVEIFGDIPMYVEFNSADVWNNPSDWQIENGKAKAVAGVPGDYFNKDGQLWGYPLYDYENMSKNKYDFWTKRFKRLSKLFDIVRIDHFVAFSRYWSIPSKSTSALDGVWVKGAGEKVLPNLVSIPNLKIVAEDLGIITEDVINLRMKHGIAGLKILQFAFDSDEDNIYKPHNYEKNCVAYIGTHDNETFMGYLNSIDWCKLNRFKRYFGLPLEVQNDVVIDSAIENLYRSSAKLVILTMQDILKLDNKARMNVPGVVTGNWLWQLENLDFGGVSGRYKYLSEIYAR